MNVFIDSDVFLIDIRYQRDKNFLVNKEFLNLISKGNITSCTSIFNLLEICGILSFNLNKANFEKMSVSFAATYDTTILFPKQSSEQIVKLDLKMIWEIIARKVAFLDSLVMSVFEETTDTNCLVGWNTKHFQGKVNGSVFSPKEFLEEYFPACSNAK